MGLIAAVYGRDLDRDGWPSVSVVMPVHNEAAHLEAAVGSVLAQCYPGPLDVCLALAPCTDATDNVVRVLAAREPRLCVIANPTGTTPVGLNRAIAATSGEVVVRVDGHSMLDVDYVRRAVATMVRTGAVNVGGRQVPRPATAFEEAVAAASTSWIGTGGARYRIGGAEGPVDTVYLGVFDRAAGERVGWFDPDLIRNQDYELNIRLRAAGGVVWFDPALAVGYRPRGSWTTLTRQYFQYGWWKAEVVSRHPDSLRARQVIAASAGPALLAGVASLAATGRRGRRAVAAGIVAAGAAAAGPRAVRQLVVAGVMAVSWSVGAMCGSGAALVSRSRPNRSRHR